MNPTSYLFGSWFVLKPQSFPPKCAPKMRERHQLFFGLRLVSKEFHPAIQTKIEQHFGGFFLSNKSVPANIKTGFYANRDPNKQEIGFIYAWSGSELWSLFKYSRVKLKNQKSIAVNVLFKAYPMVPLSCRSNLAGRYL
jgi:hypothetical protein